MMERPVIHGRCVQGADRPSMSQTMQSVLVAFARVSPEADCCLASCPVCRQGELSVWEDPSQGMVLYDCPTGCEHQDILAAAGLTVADLKLRGPVV